MSKYGASYETPDIPDQNNDELKKCFGFGSVDIGSVHQLRREVNKRLKAKGKKILNWKRYYNRKQLLAILRKC